MKEQKDGIEKVCTSRRGKRSAILEEPGTIDGDELADEELAELRELIRPSQPTVSMEMANPRTRLVSRSFVIAN